MFVIRRMQRNVVTISPNASLFEARERMRRHSIPQLPVTGENGKLIGILSNRDIREATLPVALLRGATEKEAEDLLKETPVAKFRLLKACLQVLGVGGIQSGGGVGVPDLARGLAPVGALMPDHNVIVTRVLATG